MLLQTQANGGQACPADQIRSCNSTSSCDGTTPVDCALTWSSWCSTHPLSDQLLFHTINSDYVTTCQCQLMSTHLAPTYSRIFIIPLQLLVQRRVASVRLSDSHFIFPFRPNLFSLKTRTPIVLQSDLNGGAACPAQENKTCYDASCNGQPAQAPSAGPCIGANCQPGKI